MQEIRDIKSEGLLKRNFKMGTSLVVQGLWLYSWCKGPVSIPGLETRSQVQHLKKEPACRNWKRSHVPPLRPGTAKLINVKKTKVTFWGQAGLEGTLHWSHSLVPATRGPQPTFEPSQRTPSMPSHPSQGTWGLLFRPCGQVPLWVGLYPSQPEVGVLTPRTLQCDLIWK